MITSQMCQNMDRKKSYIFNFTLNCEGVSKKNVFDKKKTFFQSRFVYQVISGAEEDHKSDRTLSNTCAEHSAGDTFTLFHLG